MFVQYLLINIPQKLKSTSFSLFFLVIKSRIVKRQSTQIFIRIKSCWWLATAIKPYRTTIEQQEIGRSIYCKYCHTESLLITAKHAAITRSFKHTRYFKACECLNAQKKVEYELTNKPTLIQKSIKIGKDKFWTHCLEISTIRPEISIDTNDVTDEKQKTGLHQRY